MNDVFMDMLKDKAKIIAYLLEVIEKSSREKEGLSMLRESLVRENPNHSVENIARCLATTMKITAKQSEQVSNLALIALVAVQSSDFDSDVVSLLNKLGRGKEAIQQMFKNKLAGK